MSRPARPLSERLMEHVVKQPGADGCWEWQGYQIKSRYIQGRPGKEGHGYGMIGSGAKRGEKILTHRAMWEMLHGPIPDGMQVLHRCDNRCCVRPKHLFLGTPRDNTQDMLRKGRAYDHKGENCPASKLTESDIIDIRTLRAFGATTYDLASAFELKSSYISAICQGRTWRHVPLGAYRPRCISNRRPDRKPRAARNLGRNPTLRLEASARMRVCDDAVEVLRETGNSTVMRGDTRLLHQIANRAGIGSANRAQLTEQSVIQSLAKQPGILEPYMARSARNQPLRAFKLPASEAAA